MSQEPIEPKGLAAVVSQIMSYNRMITGEEPTGQKQEKIWCGVCQVWRLRSELTHWTGDDAHHWLCPGCDRDLLPVLSEEEYFASLGLTDDKEGQ
jgi:hypothetical protein